VLAASVLLSSTVALQWNSATAAEESHRPDRPHVLHTDLADVLVRVRGGALCSGTPISGTRYVLTAAHCVLNRNGEVTTPRIVVRDGVSYTALSVLVDTAYHDTPIPSLDAALLVMDQVIPGPSASIADGFPSSGFVTVAGLQPLDTDGSLLRGSRHDSLPLPQGAKAGEIVRIDYATAGCVHAAATAEFERDRVRLPCGLVPGSSGGGAFVLTDDGWTLVGVVSTVTANITANSLVPLSAVQRLLDHPSGHIHRFTKSIPDVSHSSADTLQRRLS